MTSLFWGKSQASSQGLSELRVAASSRMLSLRSRTSIQWKSSHLPNVQASICFSSSSNSVCEQERNLPIKAWHSAGWKINFNGLMGFYFNLFKNINNVRWNKNNEDRHTTSEVHFFNLLLSIFILKIYLRCVPKTCNKQFDFTLLSECTLHYILGLCYDRYTGDWGSIPHRNNNFASAINGLTLLMIFLIRDWTIFESKFRTTEFLAFK